MVEQGLMSEEDAYLRAKSQHKAPSKSASGPFVAWDGEGVTLRGRHRYTLLANSYGSHITNPEGLGTEQCLNFLCDQALRDPRANHVCFGASYDVNMMLGDFGSHMVMRLAWTGVIHWGNFRIAYRPRKQLQVTRYHPGTRHVKGNREVTCTLWDVIGFFQCTFVTALDKWLKDTDPETVAFIQDMKSRRSDFVSEDPATVLAYCLRECELLEQLMTTMRNKMRPVKLIPNRWDGAGAIAGKLLQNHKVNTFRGESPPEVRRASQYAYFGGRIECVRYGQHLGQVFSHDIRSAYPSAMVSLPCLAHGSWTHSESTSLPKDGAFRIGHVRWKARNGVQGLHPMPWRHESGSVFFPSSGEGWYWQPELELLLDFMPGQFRVFETWTWTQTCQHKPFRFVPDVYVQRERMRKAGHDAHIVLKLALNSIYGKLAQKVGWKQETGQPPTYHCLEWAGWITSVTRAKLYRLAMQAPGSVIAFETDGLYSLVKHECPTGEALGEWDVASHDGIMYCQSGLYWMLDVDHETNDPEWWSKSRGLQRSIKPDYADRALTRERVLKAWAKGVYEVPVIENRFRTMAAAVASPGRFLEWRQWCDDPKTVVTVPCGKRVALPADLDSGEWATPGLHDTLAAGGAGLSAPHRLPWVDGITPEEVSAVAETEGFDDVLEELVQ